jgi:hypothetical protein
MGVKQHVRLKRIAEEVEAISMELHQAEPLRDHIKRVYGTSKAYAQAKGKTEPKVSLYIKKRCWVIDGELYSPVKPRSIQPPVH